MCAFSLPVSKTNAVVFDNGEVCATLISDQGQGADMGRFRPVCEKMHVKKITQANRSRGDSFRICRL